MTEKAGINKRMRVPESEGKAEKRSGMKNAKSAPSVVTSLGLLIFLRFSPPPSDSSLHPQRRVQPRDFLRPLSGKMTHLSASSKTFLRPFCVRAEHSM